MATDQADQCKALGNSAFQRGDNAEAVKHFSKAIELDPSQHVFFSNRSAAYAGMEMYEQALTDADECIRIMPAWSKGYSRRGLALFKLGRLDDASEAYEKGLEMDPNNEALKDGLSQVQRAMQPNRGGNPFGSLFGPDMWAKIATNPQLRPLLNDEGFKAKVNMLQKNPQLMGSMLQDPQISMLLSALLGINLSGMDPRDEGDAHMTAADEGKPRDEEIKAAGESAAAPEPEPMPMEVSPEDEEKAAFRKEAAVEKDEGNKLYKQRKFDEALVRYAKARELDPENPTFLLNESAVLIEQSNFAEAISRCNEAIELARTSGNHDFNTSAKAFARIATAYMKQDMLNEAIEALEKSLVEKYDRQIELKLKSAKEMRTKRDVESYLDPEKAVQLKEEGNAKFSAGKFGDAIEDYTESIRRNPRDPKVYSNRAACYTKLMDWGRALKDVDKALELDPVFVKAYIRKGKIQHFLKQYHKALKTYKAGLELDPQCAELREGLQAVQMAVAMENASGSVSEERRQQAMEDPEVQNILRDPQMQTLLQQMSEDPRAAQAAMADPDTREKIETLINAGVLTAR